MPRIGLQFIRPQIDRLLLCATDWRLIIGHRLAVLLCATVSLLLLYALFNNKVYFLHGCSCCFQVTLWPSVNSKHFLIPMTVTKITLIAAFGYGGIRGY